MRSRILVVHGSVVGRRLVCDALSSDPLLPVVGTAANGRIALAKIPHANPDLVILGLEIPEADGLQALTEIRQAYPLLPVLILSTLTTRGAAITLDALFCGATDYVTMPALTGSFDSVIQRTRDELIRKIETLCSGMEHRKVPTVVNEPARESRPSQPQPAATGGRRVDLVAIGTSTGGPNALAALLPEFPADLPVPIVIVQHMPSPFTRLLAERLASRCQIHVREGIPGSTLQPGYAWLAPGSFHMTVERHGGAVHIRTHQGPPENSCRPSVDTLLRSAAQTYGPHVLAVVLTGMGQDGLRGCEYVRQAGGRILVQDEASSVVWGMPRHVARAGLADMVLPLDQLGSEITRRVRQGRESR